MYVCIHTHTHTHKFLFNKHKDIQVVVAHQHQNTLTRQTHAPKTHIFAQMETACGTPEYLAPELVAMVAKGDNAETAYSSKVDVWAVGVILYVMISGFHPFYTGNQAQLYDAIMKGNYGFPNPAVRSVFFFVCVFDICVCIHAGLIYMLHIYIICMYVCVHTHLYIICMCAYIHTHTCIHTYIYCIYVCIYIYMIYIYIYI